MQGGGGSSFRGSIHCGSNLGQTGSCNFLEASLFHCSREPDRLPHNPGRGQVGRREEARWGLASSLLLMAISSLFTQHQGSDSV